MKPASGLAPSQSRKWTYQAVAKTKPRPMFNCCSALLTAINYAQIPWTFKGLCIPWDPSFILLALTKPTKDLSASDGLFLFWFEVMSWLLLQQHGNKQEAPRQAVQATHRVQRIIYGNVYLCNTHNFTCDQSAAARSPTTQCGYLQPVEAIIMMILYRECLKGRWCQAHTMLFSSHSWQEDHNPSATHLA